MRCFGFYSDNEVTCSSMCTVKKRCLAVSLTHGDAAVGSYVEELVLRLDSPRIATADFLDSDQMSVMVDQLLKGPLEEHPKRAELRGQGRLKVKAEEVDLGDID